jgi:hypothetical protein
MSIMRSTTLSLFALAALAGPARADGETAAESLRSARACVAEVAAMRGQPHFAEAGMDAFVRTLASKVEYAQAWMDRDNPAMVLRTLTPGGACEERLADWAAERAEARAKAAALIAAAMQEPTVQPAVTARLDLQAQARISATMPIPGESDRERQERLYAVYGRLPN